MNEAVRHLAQRLYEAHGYDANVLEHLDSTTACDALFDAGLAYAIINRHVFETEFTS